MDTLVVLAYIFLIVLIAALALIIIGIIKTKSCKILDVTGMILSMGIMALCITVIYLYPNRSITDFIKPVITANGIEWNFKTNPQVCQEDKVRGKRDVVMCPAWIEDNVQVCLSYHEQTDSWGHKFCEYLIRLASPKVKRNNKMTSMKWYDRMFVRLDNEQRMKHSFVTSFDEYVCCYSFGVQDVEAMVNNGVISVSYRAPNGCGLWKRMGDEGLTAINEQLIYLVNYVNELKDDDQNSCRIEISQNNESIPSAKVGNKVVVIDGEEVRLRLGPSTSSGTYKWPDGTNRHPNKGDVFRYLDEAGDFYKIDYKGQEVWVSKQFSHLEHEEEASYGEPEQSDSNKTNSNDLYDKNYIAERAKVLIDCFKRNTHRNQLVDAFSNEYRYLYTQALEIPSDNPQGIGSEDWLYGFLMVEDISMFPNEPKTIQYVDIINEKNVKVKLQYFGNHEMTLLLQNDKWILDDFDGTKIKLVKYIEEQREYFKSPEWENYLQNWLTEGDSRYSEEELRVKIAKCRKEVEDYFKKYPQ